LTSPSKSAALPSGVAAFTESQSIARSSGFSHCPKDNLNANADIPGFSDRERLLVATVARYHRRSTPDRGRADLGHLSTAELTTVRKLAALLRVANALDASHRQPIGRVRAEAVSGAVRLRLQTRAPVDLELWDVRREAALFREVFRKRIDVAVRRR